jgi:hypothetical protein
VTSFWAHLEYKAVQAGFCAVFFMPKMFLDNLDDVGIALSICYIFPDIILHGTVHNKSFYALDKNMSPLISQGCPDGRVLIEPQIYGPSCR